MRALISLVCWLITWWRARAVARWERTRLHAWMASQLLSGHEVRPVSLHDIRRGKLIIRGK
jgi:hypothetical protein